ncbi:MAG: hypothetical protein ABSA93_05860 [Streptosporangiaceae bacterium]
MTNIWGTRIMAALATMFNVLALNAVLLIASLPVITAPAAMSAAWVAMDRWRLDGEDRVVRSFVLALRTRRSGRVTVAVGIPLAAIAAGLFEAYHFVRGTSLPDRFFLGLCLVALVITLGALGYVLQFTGDGDQRPLPDLWSAAARLSLANLLITGPLFLAEVGVASAAIVIDPGLALLGLPLLTLQMMKLTARLGIRRALKPRNALKGA